MSRFRSRRRRGRQRSVSWREIAGGTGGTHSPPTVERSCPVNRGLPVGAASADSSTTSRTCSTTKRAGAPVADTSLHDRDVPACSSLRRRNFRSLVSSPFVRCVSSFLSVCLRFPSNFHHRLPFLLSLLLAGEEIYARARVILRARTRESARGSINTAATPREEFQTSSP